MCQPFVATNVVGGMSFQLWGCGLVRSIPLMQEQLQQHELHLQGALRAAADEKVQLKKQLEEEKAELRVALDMKQQQAHDECQGRTEWGRKCGLGMHVVSVGCNTFHLSLGSFRLSGLKSLEV